MIVSGPVKHKADVSGSTRVLKFITSVPLRNNGSAYCAVLTSDRPAHRRQHDPSGPELGSDSDVITGSSELDVFVVLNETTMNYPVSAAGAKCFRAAVTASSAS